mgnify:CR=1 FL=1
MQNLFFIPAKLAMTSSLDLRSVFQGSPIIYTILIILSIMAFVVWLYSVLTLKLSEMMPASFINQVREQLAEKRFEAALMTCQQEKNFASHVIACGIASSKHGPQVMMKAMQAEGQRCGNSLWQRLSLLNDIAVIAPMLGLLGTVLGMFYAFYDVNRTQESIISIFDGLGVAIGTTVLGLVVAIIAMLFHTTLKYRVVKLLNIIENEALSLSSLIDAQPLQPVLNS